MEKLILISQTGQQNSLITLGHCYFLLFLIINSFQRLLFFRGLIIQAKLIIHSKKNMPQK